MTGKGIQGGARGTEIPEPPKASPARVPFELNGDAVELVVADLVAFDEAAALCVSGIPLWPAPDLTDRSSPGETSTYL